jgi:hypothetical protein
MSGSAVHCVRCDPGTLLQFRYPSVNAELVRWRNVVNDAKITTDETEKSSKAIRAANIGSSKDDPFRDVKAVGDTRRAYSCVMPS